MEVKLELYETVKKSRKIAEYLEENRLEFNRHEERKRDHRGNYSYGAQSGFVDAHVLELYKDPERVVIQKVALEALDKAIATLNECQRSRLVKRFYEDKSYREIAKEEGVDVHAVENSIQRAVKNLRKQLTAEGYTMGDYISSVEPVFYTNNTQRTQRRHAARRLQQREAEIMDYESTKDFETADEDEPNGFVMELVG